MGITVLVLSDGNEENLKKSVDSLTEAADKGMPKEQVAWKKICGFEPCPEEKGEKKLFTDALSRLYDALQEVSTEYVSIIRAGEYYKGDSLHQGCRLFEKIGKDTDGIVLSNATRKNHKEKKTEDGYVASLEDYTALQQLPADFSGILLKTEAVKKEPFDCSFGAGWLEEFICRVLMKKGKLGYAKGASFCSLSPLTDDGGFRRQWRESGWYLDMAQHYCLQMMEKYEKDGNIPLFIQAQVLYALKLQFQVNMDHGEKGALSGETLKQYEEICRGCLKRIDSRFLAAEGRIHGQREVLPQIRSIFAQMKAEALFVRMKEESLLGQKKEDLFSQEMKASEGEVLRELATPVVLQLMEYEQGVLHLDLVADAFLLSGGFGIRAYLGREQIPCHLSSRYAALSFFGKEYGRKPFFIELTEKQIEKGKDLRFAIEINGEEIPLNMVSSGYQSRISSMVNGSYWCFVKYMVTFLGKENRKRGIKIQRAGRIRRIAQEAGVLVRMPFGENRSRKMFLERIRYWMAYPQYGKKNIWLTFDKLYKGGDCGEYFYKYLVDRKDPDITPVYVIHPKAADRKRLEREGYQVLLYGTKDQKLSYLYASMVFATHSSVHGFNGFNAWEVQYIQDRLKAVNTCIQHGLSVQNLVVDSNRIVNNNKRYYCASPYEVENLSAPQYGYKKETLCLTGIPRYDGLVNCDKCQILITPTWRSYIAMPAVLGSARPYNPEFKNTEYFRIFQELILDPVLVQTAKKTGYEIIYLLHPVISAQKEDFIAPEGVTLLSALEADYEKLLTQSSLMVTDYSGVQFDFAYMRKPVVYYHPPSLPPHFTGGGFDYETQGFGEICTGKQELVSLLKGYMEHQCELKDFYRQRQDAFFAYDDRENCRRIYEDAKQYQNQYKEQHQI